MDGGLCIQMKRTDLAYIAGIVDGEGYIGITADHHKRGRRSYRLRVTVTNTEIWLINHLKFAVGGGLVILKNPSVHRQQCWQWQIGDRKAGEFLKLILPYLHLKKPQAELGIKFQEAKGRSTRGLTDNERAVEEAQKILLQTMKRNKV